MSVRNLDHLLQPKAVAVIGASNRDHSVGRTVMLNLLAGGFSGAILPVNPKWETVAGVLAYPSIEALPRTPDLAVVCTPPETLPEIIDQLGAKGTKAAIVLTAGFEAAGVRDGKDYRRAVLEASRPHLLRILGPNCVGLLAPHAGLNASFAHAPARPGQVAFLSQSGALATAVLDWANSQGIGFSHFVSLGNCWDVDFGDLLDHLGGDPDAKAILLYVESITNARKFMSAARAAARNKPVIVIKAGRFAEGAAAAASHTGALAGADEVYDAAIRRAGLLRVDRIEDLFNAAELLGRNIRVKGERLAVVTNGGGAGVMAADAMGAEGGQLATLTAETIARLNAVLPGNWSKANPIDIIGDAPAARYGAAFEALAESAEVDAILLIQAPTAIVPSQEIAEALLPKIAQCPHPVLGCWMGGDSASAARRLFADAGIPVFDTPEAAVGAFHQLVAFRRNQALLAETPPSVVGGLQANRFAARTVIEGALAEGREMLSEAEAKAVLSCYDIPIVETRIVTGEDQALRVADELGYPVALKILSDQISHKSDVGGVVLDIGDARQLRESRTAMAARVAELRPEARVKGYTLQPMARRPDAFELILGAKNDPVFGPVLLFGQGGTAVEVVADRALGLPPMNLGLARRLVEETRIARLLKGYRDRAPVDLKAVYLTILKIAQMVVDMTEIEELDINPLLSDSAGVVALDARIRVVRAEAAGRAGLAIRPYPSELEENIQIDGERLLLRPIRPEDEPRHRAFLESMESEDIYFRFFGMIRHFEHSQLSRLTQIDFDREMAFVAVRKAGTAEEETLGVVRVVCDPDNVEGEFAIIVHSKVKGHGLGAQLMRKIVAYCRQRGTQRIVGQVLATNKAMLALAKRNGFLRQASDQQEIVELRLDLSEQPSPVSQDAKRAS
ncbi:MAG: bifunctional acetate--CoA ligase family protein/GNAT family N-acetyltransferase [Pseudomonadota bacterium]